MCPSMLISKKHILALQSRRSEPAGVQVRGLDRLAAVGPDEQRARRGLGHAGGGVPARRGAAQDGPGQEVPGPTS